MRKTIISLIMVFLIGCSATLQKAPDKITLHQNQKALSGNNTSGKIGFWLEQKKGGNFFMERYEPDYFNKAKEIGLQYIRFGPNLLPANEKDFLIGDLDDFETINRDDLELLLDILDDAYKNDIAIVLTMFELPGHRYGNPNEVETDTRLWEDEKYWRQSFDFWKELASAVKDHPAIVAYNPINEPCAAYAYGFDRPNGSFKRWLERAEGTVADLNLFNTLMIEAIREVDSETPILLDGYLWADPKGMPFLKPQEDPNILYAFHNPGPWTFSSLENGNKGRYSYPNAMPQYWKGLTEVWTIDDLNKLLSPVYQFINDNEIEPFRIIASEVWCNRRINGCAEYLGDLITLYNRNQWHWSFWAFNIYSPYTGFDYQLGDIPDSGRYIINIDKKDIDLEKLKIRVPNPIWEVLYTQFNSGIEDKGILSDSSIETRSVDELILDLDNEEWIIRDSAVLALAIQKDLARNAIPKLVQLLNDEEWLVRRSTVYALSEMITDSDKDVIMEIKRLRNDPEEQVRIEVALALGKQLLISKELRNVPIPGKENTRE